MLSMYWLFARTHHMCYKMGIRDFWSHTLFDTEGGQYVRKKPCCYRPELAE